MSEPWLALQVVMMPKDANPLAGLVTTPGGRQYPVYSTVFGGVILSYIDQAGYNGARHAVMRAGGPPPVAVTVAINRVEFRRPVLVGDVVRFRTSVVRMGRTSITIRVEVEADRGTETIPVTEAELVYVGIDPDSPDRHPVPLLPGT